jgi:hypothetical protein
MMALVLGRGAGGCGWSGGYSTDSRTPELHPILVHRRSRPFVLSGDETNPLDLDLKSGAGCTRVPLVQVTSGASGSNAGVQVTDIGMSLRIG